MIVPVIILLAISLGSLPFTYIYEKDASLLTRVCSGAVIGSALLSVLTFIAACLFGLNGVVMGITLTLTLFPFALFKKKIRRERFSTDLRNAIAKLASITVGQVAVSLFYISLLVLVYFFFDRAMIETDHGISTGSTHNYADLPSHLGAIFSFTIGNNFPPENPSFAGSRFTYPFMADLLTACLVRLGSRLPQALLAQNTLLAFSLMVLFGRFVFTFTTDRVASRFAVLILLFGGGLGFLNFFSDYAGGSQGLTEFIWNLPADYTISNKEFRWGNSFTTLFMTQRSILLGMPIALIVLTRLWTFFRDARLERRALEASEKRSFADINSLLFVGLLAGTLPLIHVHSLILLFVVSVFLMGFSLNRWRQWALFAVTVTVVAVPELYWMTAGTSTSFGKFLGWHLGWDIGEEGLLFFWINNLGLFIPILVVGLGWVFYRRVRPSNFAPLTACLFYLPFLFLFAICHLIRFAPWQWDNVKLMIYWYAASIPFVAMVLAALWKKGTFTKVLAIGIAFTLMLSGTLDVWRVASRQINIQIFDHEAVAFAEILVRHTAPDALLLNAPTYDSPAVLSGRRSFIRHPPHLASYGIDPAEREDIVKRIYSGSTAADELLEANGIDYVIIGPAEDRLGASEGLFQKYPKIAELGHYRLYQVK